MGFGSYDESEHENRENKKSIETTEETKDDGHNGEVTTEGAENTDELLSQLQETKTDE